MRYRICRVASRREMKDFLKLPQIIYKNDKYWVAPFNSEVKRILDTKKNPYFRAASLQLFICYYEDRIVSRIAIVINKEHVKKFGVRKALFGFFESINDVDAVKYLFNAVENYCAQNFVEYLEGPFNPNHYSELGMQLDHFDSPPTFFETYNPHYYSTLLSSAGFSVSKTLHTRINRNIREYIEKRYGLNPSVDYGEYKTRSFDMQNLENDLENLRGVFNNAFANNWSFLPVSKEEYFFSSKHLKLVTPANLIKFVEYRSEVVAAVHFAFNINPLLKEFNGKLNPIKYYNLLKKTKNIHDVILFAVGIKTFYRKTKVYPILFNETLKIARNYKTLETTWIDDKNIRSVRSAERFGLIPKKEFAMFNKKIVVKQS